MVTKSSREMQKDREKIRPPFGGLKFCQGTHYLPLTTELSLVNVINELIETLWNVNQDRKKWLKRLVLELIETLWNVNSSFLPYQWAIWVELIETLWNVNTEATAEPVETEKN